MTEIRKNGHGQVLGPRTERRSYDEQQMDLNPPPPAHRRFVVVKFQPWGDALLLTDGTWILMADLARSRPRSPVMEFATSAAAAHAVALWPDDGCTGVVPVAPTLVREECAP